MIDSKPVTFSGISVYREQGRRKEALKVKEKASHPLTSAVSRGGMAYVRNLVAAEEAILRGQFNVAKILRVSAHAQRTWALNAARLLAEDREPSALFAEIIEELQDGIESNKGLERDQDDSPLARSVAQSEIARQHLIDILQWSIDSLAQNSDVLERDVDIYLFGCHRCGNVMEGRGGVCDVCGALRTELEWFGPFYSRTAEHLGQLAPEEIIRVLEGIPDQVADIILDVDDEVLRHKPSADEWCAKEIVGHMLEVDRLFVQRANRILQGSGRPDISVTMPPWKLHEGKGYEKMPAAELVAHFAQVRAETVEFVRSLTPEQWSQRGVDFLGLHSLVDLGTWLANNDRGHLPQIRRLCQGE